MKGRGRQPDRGRETGLAGRVRLALPILMAAILGCETLNIGFGPPKSLQSDIESYLATPKKMTAEATPAAPATPAGPVAHAITVDLPALKGGFCLGEVTMAPDGTLDWFDSVRGAVVTPRTRPTHDPYVDEIVEEGAGVPGGGWWNVTLSGAPPTASGTPPAVKAAFDVDGQLGDAAVRSGDAVYVPACPDPLPPVGAIVRLKEARAVTTVAGDAGGPAGGMTTGRIGVAPFETDEGLGLVVSGSLAGFDLGYATRADDEEIESWFEGAYAKWGFGTPRLTGWRGLEIEERSRILVGEVEVDREVVPPPAFYLPPAPPAGAAGPIGAIHVAYATIRESVQSSLETGRTVCDYGADEAVVVTVPVAGVGSLLQGSTSDLDVQVEREPDSKPVCGRLPVVGSLFRGAGVAGGRMLVDVIDDEDRGLSGVAIDVLVDGGKVRDRPDDGRREPVVVEVDRSDEDGEGAILVDGFDVPTGTTTVAIELVRTTGGTEQRRVVLVPLLDGMTEEDAERSVRQRYPGWRIRWLDGYLAWGAGEWYSLDLASGRIYWEGFGSWGRQESLLRQYLMFLLARQYGMLLTYDWRFLVLNPWFLNPQVVQIGRPVSGVQQKLAYFGYSSSFLDQSATVPDAPGGGNRFGGGRSSGALPEIYLIDRGESTGESIEMVVLGAGSEPVELAGAVVVEPIELGPEERRRLETAIAEGGGRRMTLDGYCLQKDSDVPTEGTVMRIAGQPAQARFAGERRILFKTREMHDAGRLHPNTTPESYFHSVLQWALWTREQGYDRQGFEAAFVAHARENFEEAGREWSPATERAVRELVPARWADVQMILAEAEA